MIAVCLLTCDRRAYTQATLASFCAQNDLSKFMLLHADDGSCDRSVPDLARACGFTTVVQTAYRMGWRVVRPMLFEQAAKRGAAWVLYLENDIQWARPFPWPLFDYIRTRCPNVYTLRLYGAYKDRERLDACMTYNKTDRSQPVKWRRLKYAPEPTEVGRIHWGAQPSVTRTADLLNLHRYGMESGDLTARVTENVTYHIGVQRTIPQRVLA